MPRDYKVYLDDILEAINRVQLYIADMDEKQFEVDIKTVDAVIRNLEIIGEAVKKVPNEIKSKYPHIEWKRIGGLRDILIHEYFGVDVHIIWDIVKNKLGDFGKQIKPILDDQ